MVFSRNVYEAEMLDKSAIGNIALHKEIDLFTMHSVYSFKVALEGKCMEVNHEVVKASDVV